MFCDSNNINPDNDLKCGIKLLSEILTLISLFFSFFTVFISLKQLKMNITNILIIHIIISEILDGINILGSMIYDIMGPQTFEKYRSRMTICFTQIFLGVFSSLWTLFSCFFISLRIFDKMQNKNKIFKTKFMAKYTTTMSYAIPIIITYILWAIQITDQSNIIDNKDYKDYYPDIVGRNVFFRHMYCWVTNSRNYILFFIVLILIILNLYFSIIKSVLFIKKISNEMKDDEEDEDNKDNIQEKIKKMNRMMCSLIIYPVASAILWVFFYVIQYYFGLKDINKNGSIALIYCVVISIRQLIYTSVFFWTQSNLWKYALGLLTCKKTNRNTQNNSIGSITSNSF